MRTGDGEQSVMAARDLETVRRLLSWPIDPQQDYELREEARRTSGRRALVPPRFFALRPIA